MVLQDIRKQRQNRILVMPPVIRMASISEERSKSKKPGIKNL
jgi:hypothetical protein